MRLRLRRPHGDGVTQNTHTGQEDLGTIGCWPVGMPLHWGSYCKYCSASEGKLQDFPGGSVDKNLPANAGDAGLIPGPGEEIIRESIYSEIYQVFTI